ncbi:hypothetical protein [Helicobacter sp. MIT 01-3238]|uniref:hypothetical protein n=1 Tax=Helicobacter sp. MIT 01-3238 TaxID=398627 RepID=UPI0011C075EA|nr:hypothetical protein [Helicobacter sp. MIT 01-3238]
MPTLLEKRRWYLPTPLPPPQGRGELQIVPHKWRGNYELAEIYSLSLSLSLSFIELPCCARSTCLCSLFIFAPLCYFI